MLAELTFTLQFIHSHICYCWKVKYRGTYLSTDSVDSDVRL